MISLILCEKGITMNDSDFAGSVDVASSASPPSSVADADKTGRRKRIFVGRWLARLVLLLCFLVGLYLSLFPSGRALTRAIMIVPGLISAAQPSWEDAVVDPVEHVQKTISSTVGLVYLDVYEPSDSAPAIPSTREGLLVIPGVGDERQDPQLINFSETLARAGVVVMDITTPALIAYRLDAGDEDAVVQAFQSLQHWPGVSPERVGLFGISGGGALMCLAAADARVRHQTAFVTLFGSYFDATTLLQTIGQRELLVDGQTQPWSPVDVPLQVLANTIMPYLSSVDGQLLTGAFDPGGSESLSSSQIAQLSPDGAAVYHLLAGDERNQVEANIKALSPTVKQLLVSLSPSSVLDQISAPVYLLHDRTDQYVPFTQSRDFAAALAHIHHPYDFAEFGIFQHVEVRSGLGAGQVLVDGANLLRLVSEVVQIGS